MSFSVGFTEKVLKRHSTNVYRFSVFIPIIWCCNLKSLMLQWQRPMASLGMS